MPDSSPSQLERRLERIEGILQGDAREPSLPEMVRANARHIEQSRTSDVVRDEKITMLMRRVEAIEDARKDEQRTLEVERAQRKRWVGFLRWAIGTATILLGIIGSQQVRRLGELGVGLREALELLKDLQP